MTKHEKNYSKLFPCVEWVHCISHDGLGVVMESLYRWYETARIPIPYETEPVYPCRFSEDNSRCFVCRVPSIFPVPLGLYASRKSGDVEYRILPSLCCLKYSEKFVESFPILCTQSRIRKTLSDSATLRHVREIEEAGACVVEMSNHMEYGNSIMDHLRRIGKVTEDSDIRPPVFNDSGIVDHGMLTDFDDFFSSILRVGSVKPEYLYRNDKREGVYVTFVNGLGTSLWTCSMTPFYGKTLQDRRYDRITVRLYKTSHEARASFSCIRKMLATVLEQYIVLMQDEGKLSSDDLTVLHLTFKTDPRMIPDSVMIALGFKYELASVIKTSLYWTTSSGVLGCYAGDTHEDGKIRSSDNRGYREWMAKTLPDIHASLIRSVPSSKIEENGMCMTGYYKVPRQAMHVWSSEISITEALRCCSEHHIPCKGYPKERAGRTTGFRQWNEIEPN